MNNGPVMGAGGGNGGNNYPMNTFNNGFNGMGGMPYFPMGNRGSFMGNFGDMMGGSQRGRMRNTNYRMPRGGGNTGNNGGNGNYMGDGAGFGGK
jgi:hypothetical protein